MWTLILCFLAMLASPLRASEGSVVLEEAAKGVVNIAVHGNRAAQVNPLLRDTFFRRFMTLSEPIGSGSGVIVDSANGYIVTNRHIVQLAESVTVTLWDRRAFPARLVGADTESNLAVLQIQADNLTALTWIPDLDSVEIGEPVWILGNPFAKGLTVAQGIISGASHLKLFAPNLSRYIHTTASIHAANSGGPVIDSQGRLLGIATDRALPQRRLDFGLAIASPIAQSVVRQLIEYGDIQPGRVGVSVQDLTYDLIEAFQVPLRQGAIVTEAADPETPLEAGDIIVEFNGFSVVDAEQFQSLVKVVRQGTLVPIVYYRDNVSHNAVVRIESIPEVAIDGLSLHPTLNGSVFSSIPKDLIQYQNVQGVYVKTVLPGSRAWNNNLRQGDIILTLNRWRIRSLDVFQRVTPRIQGAFILYLLRDQRRLRIIVN